jgi:hypothetical protein
MTVDITVLSKKTNKKSKITEMTRKEQKIFNFLFFGLEKN